MIIFLNGSFGAGKTTTAELLHKSLPKSMIYDPEEVGFMLRSILKPIDPKENFQDYPLWRRLVPQIASSLLDEYHGPLIMPMTVYRLDYFQEITTLLKQIDPTFYSFVLVASPDTICSRLHTHENYSWALTKVQEAVHAFKADDYGMRIDTETHSPQEVVEKILKTIR